MNMIIYLPEYAMKSDESLIEAFYDFITCYVQGHWNQRREGVGALRGPEIDTYCALRYEGEVNNGGHNQYINNLDNNQDEFDAALAGLKFLGAKAHTAVLADMMQWARENPSEVEKMLNTHYFVKQSALEELNDRFFDIDEMASVKQLAANWVKTHPNLRIIPEPEFMAINNAHLSGVSSGLA